MAKIIQFSRGPEHELSHENTERMMEDGKFYDLQPPANIDGELYNHVQCEYQVPNSPNEYSVKGVPQGGTEIKAFILRFTKK